MNSTQGIGARVQLVRLERGLSQRSFARLALSSGASARNIGRIEYEEVAPRRQTLQKIASFGDVDLQWLIHGGFAPKRAGSIVRAAGIGQRLAALRRSRGLSMRALAKASGLGESAKNVQRLETGAHRPRAATVQRLAEVLGVEPAYLAFGA